MEYLIIAVYAGVFGLLLGSFSTMLIHRLHFEEAGILTGRSHCRSCDKTLGWKDLFPVFSWLFSGGKCRQCGAKVSVLYPVIELVFGIVFVLFALKFWGTPDFWFVMPTIFFVLVCFFYDSIFTEVDDRVIFPAVLLVGLWAFFREMPLAEYFIGAALGWAFYAVQYFGSKGLWVGAGDMRLGAFMGLVLGWKLLLMGFFVAYVVGTLVGVYLMIFRKANGKSALPMGAFLMPALLWFMYDGYRVWDLYLDYLGL